MSDDVAAYRSSDPEVLAESEAWKDEMREQHERVRAFKERVDPDGKLTLRAYRNGVPAHFTGDWVPDGWRRMENGRIVPNKRVKAGKAVAAEMEDLRRSAPRGLEFRLKGVPDFVMGGDRWHSPGAFEYDGALYLWWNTTPHDIDTGVWTKLKLSEFYAVKEAFESEKERAAA